MPDEVPKELVRNNCELVYCVIASNRLTIYQLQLLLRNQTGISFLFAAGVDYNHDYNHDNLNITCIFIFFLIIFL